MQQLPGNYEEIVQFHHFIINCHKEHSYPLHWIANMDETLLMFDMPLNHMINNTGEKTIKIRTTGKKKSYYNGDGLKIKPMVIFKRKTFLKISNKHGVVMSAQEKGWMDSDQMKIWIQRACWSQTGGLGRRHSLLVYDTFEAHLTDIVKASLKRENTNLAVIRGGLISLLQPLDVSFKRPFKD